MVLQDLTGPFRAIAESTPDAVVITDHNLNIIFWNNGAEKIFGYTADEVIGMQSTMLSPKRYKKLVASITAKARKDDIARYPGKTSDMVGIKKNGSEFAIEVSNFFWKQEGAFCYGAIIRDITRRKKAEMALEEARNVLEDRVRDRTATLTKTNEELRTTIATLKRAERELQKKGTELKKKTAHLEEANIALKVLLQKRDEDRNDMEEKILSNVRVLIDPYLDKLKHSCRKCDRNMYIDILDAHLKDITAPFAKRLASSQFNFTASEIQIAKFIRAGKRSKEIADLLNVSVNTVKFHRNNIRKKLGISSSKKSLQAFLAQFEKE